MVTITIDIDTFTQNDGGGVLVHTVLGLPEDVHCVHFYGELAREEHQHEQNIEGEERFAELWL